MCQKLREKKVLTGNALKAFVSMKHFFTFFATLRAAVSQKPESVICGRFRLLKIAARLEVSCQTAG
jgi:hypothetical protein